MSYPQHVREAVLSDYRDSVPVHAIVKRHGVSAESIRSWAIQAGIARREGNIGRCQSCHSSALIREGVCSQCRSEIPLTGGSWVPRRGIVVWQVAS